MPALVNWLVKDFKASIIRSASMACTATGTVTCSSQTLQKQLMINVVDQAIKNGIYVLIDWHDHNGHLHTPAIESFFCRNGKKIFSGVPNVIYEIWNEPERDGLGHGIKDYALQIIPEIRKYDAKNLISSGQPTLGPGCGCCRCKPGNRL
jgi:endoglucanase